MPQGEKRYGGIPSFPSADKRLSGAERWVPSPRCPVNNGLCRGNLFSKIFEKIS